MEMRFLGSRALISTSKPVLLFCVLAILIILTGCQAAPTSPSNPSPFYTPLPPAVKTRIRETQVASTYTPGPLSTLAPSDSIQLAPTPVYDIPPELVLEACYPPVVEGTPITERLRPCSDFTTSDDGRYLGYFFGRDTCGRKIVIMDQMTGDPVFQTEFSGGHKFEFLANGKVLISTGHCEGGKVELLDLATGDLRKLGAEGFELWNPQHAALAVLAIPHVGYRGKIWGYNVSDDLLFLPDPEAFLLDNHMLWTPDGSHLLYQHRDMFQLEGTLTDSFPTGRQIIRVNASSGEVTILAGDPVYDFHLCAGFRSGCDRWHGDWVQVRRFAYQPQQVEFPGEDTPATLCLLYGMECEGEPVLFALNWRTGEMIPWDESILPTPIPTITPTPGGEHG